MPGLSPTPTFVSGSTRLALLFLGFALALLPAGRAWAQNAGVVIDVEQKFVGIGGEVQPGRWTPVRISLTNQSTDNVEVDCRWLLTDDDGDQLIAERRNITITAQRAQSVWLYANPPMSTNENQDWVFQVVDSDSGRLIEQRLYPVAGNLVDPSENLVGVCGFSTLGLADWQNWYTQHEQITLVRGLSLATLPDRWYGLDALSALVWYRNGEDQVNEPTGSRVSPATKRALREWVVRGGHLVIIMPYGGQQWTSGDSGLADLIAPLTPGDIHSDGEGRIPLAVFGARTSQDPVPLTWFDLSNQPEPDARDRELGRNYTGLAEFDLITQRAIEPAEDDPDAVRVAEQTEKRDLVVSHRVGFGQVTLVGIDLSQDAVTGAVNDMLLHRIWTRIFSWRASKSGSLLPKNEAEGTQTSAQYHLARDANHVELGNWIAPRIARQRETGPAISLAFVLFVIYAIAAALTFPTLLRSRNWERHSWMLFVGVVALFSAIAWGGAWAMRPSKTTAAHFTVLDIDGNTNTVRARSWQSVLVPSFSDAQFKVASDPAGFARIDMINLLSSPGNARDLESPGYPDQRSYAFDSTRPDDISIPMRSTTKSLIVEFLGSITSRQDGLKEAWDMPLYSLRIADNGLPAGTITHRFDESLTDVRVIYCPGGGQAVGTAGSANRPLVYTYRNAANQSVWEPGTPLVLPASASAYTPLWIQPNLNTTQRIWEDEGFLGQQIRQRGFNPGAGNNSNLVNDIPLLTFYDALPPPQYHRQDDFIGGITGAGHYNTYDRALVRDLDLTPLITGRRIILIGHLRNGPSPVPLTVDGDTVDSDGWTVVRWIYDL